MKERNLQAIVATVVSNSSISDKEFEICLVIATFLLIASIVSYHLFGI